ncbi:exosome complex exonuclease Rrp41 [Candidatus Micrarchaeota archaeon CG11_big_fil_rev_8_21_14_0_20_47_5]|nr:MAG: exosome complex exonuclease Rrp41 [Candidatus Micrarchaeota archaeon CG1_02_47_40]PIN84328.1 MAG: exosome complex exonuclease Rrp41 [Candidatus Micrarchaeota archaeon CG11_big_fil_rev_8_21_14_0_20_47_5]
MGKPKLLNDDGKRLDGRALDELRPLKIAARVLNDANGSAYVHWGKNRVLAGVYGPRECIPKHNSSPYAAQIKCRYNMAPFCSLEEHGRSGPSRRSVELSKVIRETFENVIIAGAYPKTQIDIYIEILQSDGGTRCAAITAAAVALADAGIPLKDMVSAVAVGKVEGKISLDLSKEEDNFGQSDMPIAFASRNGDVLLLQMDGQLTKEEIAQGLQMARNACVKISALQAEALRTAYDGAKNGEKQLDLSI